MTRFQPPRRDNDEYAFAAPPNHAHLIATFPPSPSTQPCSAAARRNLFARPPRRNEGDQNVRPFRSVSMINRPENEPFFSSLKSGNRTTVFLDTFFRLNFHTQFADQSRRAIGDRWAQTAVSQGRRSRARGQSFGWRAESNRCFSPLAWGAENAWNDGAGGRDRS